MENKTKIVANTRVFLSDKVKSVKQPNVDYLDLLQSLQDESQIDDMRKTSFYTKTDLSKEDDQSISTISKESLIPIPGMLIEYENSESGDSVPMSNWVAPHGPQWGPGLR